MLSSFFFHSCQGHIKGDFLLVHQMCDLSFLLFCFAQPLMFSASRALSLAPGLQKAGEGNICLLPSSLWDVFGLRLGASEQVSSWFVVGLLSGTQACDLSRV